MKNRLKSVFRYGFAFEFYHGLWYSSVIQLLLCYLELLLVIVMHYTVALPPTLYFGLPMITIGSAVIGIILIRYMRFFVMRIKYRNPGIEMPKSLSLGMKIVLCVLVGSFLMLSVLSFPKLETCVLTTAIEEGVGLACLLYSTRKLPDTIIR